MNNQDPLRHHRAHQTKGVFGDSLAERTAEKVASGLGSTKFVIISSGIIVIWVLMNALTALNAIHFDKYPFILLNLAFSAQAFYTGALVIIAQKSQARKDAAKELADAEHREELAQAHTEMLQENTGLTKTIHGQTCQLDQVLTLQDQLIKQQIALTAEVVSLPTRLAGTITAKPAPAKTTPSAPKARAPKRKT